MKVYIVFKNGLEMGLVRAGSINAAEAKAVKKYGDDIQVVYTEL